MSDPGSVLPSRPLLHWLVFSLGTLGFVWLGLAGCGKTGARYGYQQSAAPRELSPDVDRTDRQQLRQGNTRFALDLLQETRAGQRNVLFSPISISVALAMTYAGAREETAAQMEDALHFELPPERLHPAFDDLLLALGRRGEGLAGDDRLQLLLAQSLWLQVDYPLLPGFLDTLAVHYGTGVYTTDFLADSEGSRQAINGWVEDRTAGHIDELLPSGSVTADTRLVIVNALYFDARWQTKFKAGATVNRPFHPLDGGAVPVPMMHGIFEMPYAVVDGMTVVELPYLDDSLVMTVLLPDAGRFEEQIDALDATRLASLLGQTSEVRVQLGLPKLDLRYALDLIPPLESFGMTDAFDWRVADLTGMDGGYGTLFIAQVLHQATAAVMEGGTVASAATGVVVNEFDAGAPPPVGVEVDVDRPYVFLIRDRPTDAILFLGLILDPLG